jgi:glutathione S-transferase
MKFYTFPASTVARPVAMFLADHNITVEAVVIDLMKGEQYKPEFLALNPNHAVPVLVDGDLTLCESSSILKYLADKVTSPTYPKDLKARARVNEAMDWFNTGFYQFFGYDLCYEQLLDHYKLQNADARAKVIERGRALAESKLEVLNNNMLGDGRAYICGSEMTLADYLGSGILSVGEITGCGFAKWPNVQAWLKRMKARQHWQASNGAIYGWAEAVKSQDFVTV